MWDWKTESVLAKGPSRIAVIMAHPDDPDHGCAGTLAMWSEMGHHVTYVIVTNGDKGSDDRGLSRDDLIATREREQRDAAGILGLADCIFLGYEDGMVVPDLNLRRDIVRVIRRLKPDIVMCDKPDGWFYADSYINHPDHRAVATATLEAVFPAAQNHRYFPELLDEGLEPHKVREVWIDTFGEDASTFVDVGPYADRKIEALRAHVSQMLGSDPDEWIREWMREVGKKHEPPCEYAESFKVMRINVDPDIPTELEDSVEVPVDAVQ
jgi:LmbE family N-acetylglucosaminyl deacetylase